MPVTGGDGPGSDELENLDTQEVPERVEVGTCWKVINQQSEMLQTQQALLKSMMEEIKSLKGKVDKLTPKTDHDESKLSVDEVVKMMDRRGSPPPEPFDISMGGSFDEFMERFEAYCRGKYSPTTYDRWTGELENFLKGEIYQVFKVWGGGMGSLTEMKDKLKKYCEADSGKDMSSKLRKLATASPEVGEPLHIYAYRLEKLYVAAHTGTNPEYCIELHTRLLTTLPPKCSEEIQREIDQQKITLGIYMVPWSKIVQMLKCYSERNANLKSTPENHGIKNDPIWFTSTNVYGSSHQNNPDPPQRPSRSRQRHNNQRQPRSQSFSGGPQGYPVFNNNFNGNLNRNNGNFNFNYKPFPKPICTFCGQPGHEQKVCWKRLGGFKPKCNFCRLPGHEEKICWRKLGCCVRCGKYGHFARECPQPRRQRKSGQQSSSYNNQNNYQSGNHNTQVPYQQNRSQGYYNNRSLSLDRQNYLQSTPLNPNSPAWLPQSQTNTGANNGDPNQCQGSLN